MQQKLNYISSLISWEMKNYSFSNIASEESYVGRKSNDFSNLYRHSQLKTSEANLRIEEIKKKYDTPSRRQRIQSLKKSKDYDMGTRAPKQQTRDSIYQPRPPPTFGNNHLKQSFAVNRLEKSRLKNDMDSKEFINLKPADRDYRRSNEKQNDFGTYITQNRQEEQAIFSKVREMKESIINNDYMKSSINGKSTIKPTKYGQYTQSKFEGKKETADPRVENIDKINSKIKHILSSLSENEKNLKYNKDTSTPSYMKDSATASFLKDTSIPNYPKDTSIPSYPKDTLPPSSSYLKNTPSSYLKESNASSFLKDTTFACEKQESATPNKQSAFFGMKGKDISQSKKSYDSHLHKNSDVVQKYNIYQPKTKEPPTSTLQNQRGSKYDPFSSKSNLDYQRYKNKDYSVNKIDYSKDYSANKYQPYSKEYSVSRPPKQNDQVLRTPTYLSKYQIQSKALRGSRSKSQIDSFKKSTLAGNQNGDQLRSGKKLNDQISKIQKKIEQFQKEKRKLNIEFTPFTLKNKSTANLNGDLSQGVKQQPQKQNEQSRDTSKNAEQRSSSYDYKFKSYMNRAATYEQKYGDFNNKTKDSLSKELPPRSSSIYDNMKPKCPQPPPTESDYKNQSQSQSQQPVQISTVRINHTVQNNQEKNINEVYIEIDEVAIKKRTDEGIELRRKRLQGQDQIIKSQSLKKLVILFCEQVKLDQNLRNLKIWLQSSFQPQKNSQLLKALEKQGLKLTLRECETIFTVDQSEHNPFFSVQNFEGSMQGLALAYVQADTHWKTKIQHKFEKSSLLSQGFSWQKIDLQRKDYIELQDLVRFLNIESGTFYRNRDLFLIFRRFTSSQKLKFEAMLSQISA